MFFKCKCPAKYLSVQKDHTISNVDEDFKTITYHLYCMYCGKKHDISYAHMIGGVDGFLNRERVKRGLLPTEKEGE